MAMNPATLVRRALTARAQAPQRAAAVEVAVSSTPQPTGSLWRNSQCRESLSVVKPKERLDAGFAY